MSEHPQVCFATLGQDEPWTMANYKKLGGYEAWEKILKEKIPFHLHERLLQIEKRRMQRVRGLPGL